MKERNFWTLEIMANDMKHSIKALVKLNFKNLNVPEIYKAFGGFHS